MAPQTHSSPPPPAQRPQTHRRALHILPKIATRVAVTDGVASPGGLGVHRAVEIFREPLHYERMNMIPSNCHLIKNVTGFGASEMTLGWAWNEVAVLW